MTLDAEVQCRCGQVHGRVTGASPDTVNRAVCYCRDCQAFLHHLGRTDLLDEHGGSDIVQVAPASLTFDRGADLIAGLRLSPKGLHRFYTTCCKTPVGNTQGKAVPYVGIIAQAFSATPGGADAVAGKSRGAVYGQHAVGTPPAGSTKLQPRLLLHAIRLLLGWKLGGKGWPNPFFDPATGAPNRPMTILSPAERESLRPLCGPRPA